MPSSKKIIIIGGGPSGLTAAYEITKRNYHPTVLEKLDKVGGIARTEQFEGYFFDMGGHRFFTKSETVKRRWNEILKDGFLVRPRLSRIYYEQKFFDYPLKPWNALKGLGVFQSFLIAASYLRWQVFPYQREDTFEQWVTNRFGSRLFNIFFKSYTEKVWGIPTSELSAEWAAQRIKGLSLKSAILNMFINQNDTITTLIEEFQYPERGPGMLWNTVKGLIEQQGGKVRLNSDVIKIQRSGSLIKSVHVKSETGIAEHAGTDFISSMPISEFIQKLDPPPPKAVLDAARKLSYRAFLTICLIVDREHLFDDNWIYVHDPDVQVGRIQNYKNWSPFMVPDFSKTSLGLEYFCNEGDELWNMADNQLVEMGKKELEHIDLANKDEVIGGRVFRVEKSYPVYDSNYAEFLETIRGFTDSLENFQTIGRNGLHRYNNQGHAMLTGILAVRNLLDEEKNDLWNVNAEQDYHEEIHKREIPFAAEMIDEAFARAFMKIDPAAFGISLGIVSGFYLFLMTLIVSIMQVEELVFYFGLLNQYFPGYGVNLSGSVIGFISGFLIGFLVGWSIIALRNTVIRIYISVLRRRAEVKLLEEYGYFPDEQSARATDGDKLAGD